MEEKNTRTIEVNCTNEEFALITSIFEDVLYTRPKVRYKVIK